MFKKIILILPLVLSVAINVAAQLYAPGYANYEGVGYSVLPNGYYYGQIRAGYPQGEGYYYFADPQMGAVFYHGDFDRGVCDGQGEVVSNSGYICGMWSNGDFISQTYVQTQQMQQSYYDVWSNFWNYFVTTPTYTPSYDWCWSAYSYPVYNYNTYSYPSYNYPTYSCPTFDYSSYFDTTSSHTTTTSNNYHASTDVKIPANTKITQIDSDTQLGRQLLGKIGR